MLAKRTPTVGIRPVLLALRQLMVQMEHMLQVNELKSEIYT